MSLARTCEGPGIKLLVNVTPRGQFKPECFHPECHIVGHAGMKVILPMAGGNDVEVCHEVRGSHRLVGGQVVGIH